MIHDIIHTVKTVTIDMIGLPVVLLGMWFNLDNINSLLLAIGGIIYLGLRIRGQYLKNKLTEKQLDEKDHHNS